MEIKTIEELDENLCEYCRATNYGEGKSGYSTPTGYVSCEGRWCNESYINYLDNMNITEKVATYALKVKLVNKEIFNNGN